MSVCEYVKQTVNNIKVLLEHFLHELLSIYIHLHKGNPVNQNSSAVMTTRGRAYNSNKRLHLKVTDLVQISYTKSDVDISSTVCNFCFC